MFFSAKGRNIQTTQEENDDDNKYRKTMGWWAWWEMGERDRYWWFCLVELSPHWESMNKIPRICLTDIPQHTWLAAR